jgi:ribosomal protein L17
VPLGYCPVAVEADLARLRLLVDRLVAAVAVDRLCNQKAVVEALHQHQHVRRYFKAISAVRGRQPRQARLELHDRGHLVV